MSCSYRPDSEKLQPDKLHGLKPIPQPTPLRPQPTPPSPYLYDPHPRIHPLEPTTGVSQDFRFSQDCPVPRALSAPTAKHSQAKIQAPPPQGTAARRVSQPHMFRA